MRRFNESESFYFETVEALTNFLKQEQSYEDKSIDRLLEEKFDEDEYCDAHERTTTIVRLVPDNSGGFTLVYQRTGVEYDNYL